MNASVASMPRLSLLSILALAGPLAAQETAAPADKPKEERAVRFLAVGDLPTYRQEIRNGVAFELDPPPGSVPPRQVTIAGGRDQSLAAVLQLGSAGLPLKIPAAERALRVFNGPVGETPWVQLALPEKPEPALVILWRPPGADGRQGSWDKPAALLVRDGPEQAGPRTVRVVNVSPLVAAVQFGKETVRLAPRAVWLRRHPGAGELPFSVAVAGGEGWIMLHAGAIDCRAQERVVAVVYRADGERPRRPAKLALLRERTEAVNTPPTSPAAGG